MRQILAYERDVMREQYNKHVSELLLGPKIRAHIKEVVLGLAGAVRNPEEGEWRVLQEVDRDLKNPLRNVLWRAPLRKRQLV